MVFLDNNYLNKYVMQYELHRYMYYFSFCGEFNLWSRSLYEIKCNTISHYITGFYKITQWLCLMFNVCRYTWGKVREGEKKVMDLLYYKHWSSPIFDPRTNTDIFKLLKHNKHQLNELHLPPSTSPYIVLLNTKQYRNR